MIANMNKISINSQKAVFWLSIFFLSLMCSVFIVNVVEGNATVLYENDFFRFTIAGLFGVLSLFSYYWHVSKKGRPNFANVQHILFSFGLTASTVILYLIMYVLFSWLEK